MEGVWACVVEERSGEREGERARWDYSRDFEQCICSRGMTVSFMMRDEASERAYEQENERQ